MNTDERRQGLSGALFPIGAYRPFPPPSGACRAPAEGAEPGGVPDEPGSGTPSDDVAGCTKAHRSGRSQTFAVPSSEPGQAGFPSGENVAGVTLAAFPFKAWIHWPLKTSRRRAARSLDRVRNDFPSGEWAALVRRPYPNGMSGTGRVFHLLKPRPLRLESAPVLACAAGRPRKGGPQALPCAYRLRGPQLGPSAGTGKRAMRISSPVFTLTA